jgi:hypothetical protein
MLKALSCRSQHRFIVVSAAAQVLHALQRVACMANYIADWMARSTP